MAKKRKGVGHGASREQDDDYKRRKQSTQKAQMSGPGILLTTVRRKERKAGLELIEYLDDLVEKLYPDLDLTIPEPAAITEERDEYEDDDDALDAMMNGNPPVLSTANTSASATEKQPTFPSIPAPRKPKEDEDIEAQLKAELAELRSKGTNVNGADKTSQKEIQRPRKKFIMVDPDVECLMFVSVAWPLDPVRLCCALLEEVAKTGQVRGHFIQRLSPIYNTTRADGLHRVEELAREIIEKHYPSSTEPVSTFKVDIRMRLHNQLPKMDIIQAVAAQIPRPHHADLSKPDFVINVEVLKMTIGIGILPRYEEYKRYNPQMIAQKYNQDHTSDGLASRTLLTSPKLPPPIVPSPSVD